MEGFVFVRACPSPCSIHANSRSAFLAGWQRYGRGSERYPNQLVTEIPPKRQRIYIDRLPVSQDRWPSRAILTVRPDGCRSHTANPYRLLLDCTMKQVATLYFVERHLLMLDSQHLVPSAWRGALLGVLAVFLLPIRSSICLRIVGR